MAQLGITRQRPRTGADRLRLERARPGRCGVMLNRVWPNQRPRNERPFYRAPLKFSAAATLARLSARDGRGPAVPPAHRRLAPGGLWA